MIVAVQGCCHGELDTVYSAVKSREEAQGVKVDILLCCGDFQAIRNDEDLEELVCPLKYKAYRDFCDYYTGKKVAPVLTVFVGGNHEAPELLRNLYFGGWVAPNIWYLGRCGVIRFGGLRIAGLSGIYKGCDYRKGYFERRPYNDSTRRSSYHVRSFDIDKLCLEPVDVVMSHDWPRGIERFGNLELLLQRRPRFRWDVEEGKLGNPGARLVLDTLKPRFWFSGHMHVKYEARVNHKSGACTNFLALDKAILNRPFLDFVHVPSDRDKGAPGDGEGTKVYQLGYDREWLAILVANTDRMPCHTFSSQNQVPVRYPDESHFAQVDALLSGSKLEEINGLYKVPPCKQDHLNPQGQRQEFMAMLNLPSNPYLSDDAQGNKVPVILKECRDKTSPLYFRLSSTL